jgi:hypothetical protein
MTVSKRWGKVFITVLGNLMYRPFFNHPRRRFEPATSRSSLTYAVPRPIISRNSASAPFLAMLPPHLLCRSTGNTALVFAGKRSVILQPRILACIMTSASFTRRKQASILDKVSRNRSQPASWQRAAKASCVCHLQDSTGRTCLSNEVRAVCMHKLFFNPPRIDQSAEGSEEAWCPGLTHEQSN